MNEASLMAAHQARLDALIANDTEALAQVVGEDMTFIGPDGGQISRADVVAAIHAGTLITERMDCFDISTRLYGDIGVLLYSAHARTSDGVVTFEGRVRCTTVYYWRDGGWQMVSQHQSRMPA
ncbi:MAG: nuclear transport factor 2 family protein [Pseudomonadota bacterium]